MIRSFTVQLNAAHPELPLFEATAIVGSASTAFIRRVPASVGSWHITKVYVNAQYPDGSNVTVEARVGAEGVWTATLPATETSGRVKSGFSILADGIDENGDPITSYILGIADYAVYTRDLKVQPGAVSYQLKYFDTEPDPAKKGDVAPFGGDLKLYNGSAWVGFSAESISNLAEELSRLSDNLAANYYTKDQTDEAIDRLAAYYITYNAAGANFPTRAALIGATTYYSGGVPRVPTRNDYATVLADETHDGAEYRYIYGVAEGATTGQWEAQYPIETNDYSTLSNKPRINGITVEGDRQGCGYGLVGADTAGVAIGSNACISSCSTGIAIGSGASSTCASVAIGCGAYTNCDGSVAIGPNACNCAEGQVSIGCYAGVSGEGAGVAIGCGASSYCSSVAIGCGASTNGDNSVAIGASACAGTDEISFGFGSCGVVTVSGAKWRTFIQSL